MNETQSPVQDEADGLVYQRLSGNDSAYWSYDPIWLYLWRHRWAKSGRHQREYDWCRWIGIRIATTLHLIKTFNKGLRQVKCLKNKRSWECYAWTPCNNDGNWYLRPISNQHCSRVSRWHDGTFLGQSAKWNIWYQSSMNLERILGINQREVEKLSRWTLELKKKWNFNFSPP